MRALLDTEAIKVTKATTNDPGRPILGCVLIENGEVLGADGFMLVRRKIETHGRGSLLIPAKTIRSASKVLGKNLLLTSENNEDVTIVGQYGDELPQGKVESKLELKSFEGNFPEYGKLYPVSEPIGHIAFNPKLLKRICEVAENEAMIIFRVRKREEPVEFLAGDDISGLVMPMGFQDEKIDERNKRWHPTKKDIIAGLKGKPYE
jgi:hypothetical protein